MDDRKKCREMLALEDGLSRWEIDFLESIDRQLETGRTLTPRQAEILDKIWQRH